jgi:hypothetical protein
MAIASAQSAAPKSGSEEISELADAFAVAAVRYVIEPDEDAILQARLDLVMRQLISLRRPE